MLSYYIFPLDLLHFFRVCCCIIRLLNKSDSTPPRNLKRPGRHSKALPTPSSERKQIPLLAPLRGRQLLATEALIGSFNTGNKSRAGPSAPSHSLFCRTPRQRVTTSSPLGCRSRKQQPATRVRTRGSLGEAARSYYATKASHRAAPISRQAEANVNTRRTWFSRQLHVSSWAGTGWREKRGSRGSGAAGVRGEEPL